MPSLRVVNYAVNGAGVGHLARLVAINRWVRRYALFLGLQPEIYFLTSSEAEGLLLRESFATFKLPSKTVIERTGIDKLAYLALAKQWVWHSLGLLRPDLLVVDTFPRGSFGELLSSLDLARHRAFIYRPVKAEVASRPDFQGMLPLYDLLLVPEHEAEVIVPDRCQEKLRMVGPTVGREPWELLPREAARAALGIPDGHRALYISAGGGGDPGAEQHLLQTIDALQTLPDVHLVVAAGPLYPGRPVYRPGLSWLQGWGSADYLLGIDLAITAAGYNTCAELWLAGIPALFLPQPKVADAQDSRAQRAVDAGAGEILDSLQPAPLLDAVRRWLEPQRLNAGRAAARTLLPHNCARGMAAELLRLTQPSNAPIDAMVETLSDERMAGCPDFASWCELLRCFKATTHRHPGRVADICLEILRRSPYPSGDLGRLAQIWSAKLERWSPLARAQAFLQLLPELGSWANPRAAVTTLRLLVNERELEPLALAEQFGAALSRCRERGQDLYGLVQALSEAQGTGRHSGNARLLERV